MGEVSYPSRNDREQGQVTTLGPPLEVVPCFAMCADVLNSDDGAHYQRVTRGVTASTLRQQNSRLRCNNRLII